MVPSRNMTFSEFAFPLKPHEYAPAPVPTLAEWHQLWKAWELVTQKMIPSKALYEKPIPLRHQLIFYLGHIPTFEDIHLTRATASPPTEPEHYQTIFERGIDPDVDDPTQCHDHSEVPETWPPLDEILDFRARVCARITSLYSNRCALSNRTIGRALWIGFEHEALHLETFLFMTLLSSSVKPPPGPRPDFAAMAEEAAKTRVENRWFDIRPRTFRLGLDDPEDDAGPDRFFAWDNEREPYAVTTGAFQAQARPASNGEYAEYLFESGRTAALPNSWSAVCKSRGYDDRAQFSSALAVKTVYGLISLSQAADWPVYISWNEAKRYADWHGARIPTLHEVRSIHEQVEEHKAAQKPSLNGAPNGHQLSPDPTEMFVDLASCNVGLQNFHPTPVTQKGDHLCGLGDMGGAWEWTSSLFAPQKGFKPMEIYPGYSADFMDGKHMTIVGGSWAVHPRIAGRKCFQNWWQKGYLYPWVTVRLARDKA